jgi:hypothetical protein
MKKENSNYETKPSRNNYLFDLRRTELVIIMPQLLEMSIKDGI